MSTIKIATRDFTADYDGEQVTVHAGERVDSSHELVSRYPDCWRTRGLEEELEIRSARIADIQRQDDDRAARTALEKSPAVKRAREQEAFWRSAQRVVDPGDDLNSDERREQRFYDQALEDVEQARADRFDAEMEDFSKAWGRRIA